MRNARIWFVLVSVALALGCGGEKEGEPGTSPKGAGSEGAKPEGAKPEGAKPEGAKPEGAKPDGAKPEGAVPKSAVTLADAPLPEHAIGRIGTTLLRHGKQTSAVAMSPDGSLIASSDKVRVMIWRTADGTRAASLLATRGSTLIFTPDGSTLITAEDDGYIQAWDTQTFQKKKKHRVMSGYVDEFYMAQDDGQPSPEDYTHSKVREFAITPDAKTLAALHTTGWLEVHDIAAYKRIKKIKTRLVHADAIAISADGKLVAIAGSVRT